MSANRAVYDPKVAELVLDAAESIAQAMAPPCRAAFEELTAEPGEMPRLMLKPTASYAVERRYISGWRRENGVFLLTSQGVGCEGVPLRLGTAAEVHLITLRRAAQADTGAGEA